MMKSKEELDEITDEYRIFGIKKAQMLETIKILNKQLIEQQYALFITDVKQFAQNKLYQLLNA